MIFWVFFGVRYHGYSSFSSGTYTAAQANVSIIDAYRILSFNCVMLWLRLMNVMTISPRLGPLIRMITLMLKDVSRFMILLFMYIFGFAGVFHVWFSKTVGDDAADVEQLRVSIIESLNGTVTPETDLESAGYSSFWLSSLTLFSASLGDFSFSEIYKEQTFFGPVLMIVYLFVGAVMLLNLLIALLASVYEEVQSQAKAEHSYGKAKTVSVYGIFWNTGRTWIALPPPLNLITLPLRFLIGLCYLAMKLANLWDKPVGSDGHTDGSGTDGRQQTATVKVCCFKLTVAGAAVAGTNHLATASHEQIGASGTARKSIAFVGQLSYFMHMMYSQSRLWLSFSKSRAPSCRCIFYSF